MKKMIASLVLIMSLLLVGCEEDTIPYDAINEIEECPYNSHLEAQTEYYGETYEPSENYLLLLDHYNELLGENYYSSDCLDFDKYAYYDANYQELITTEENDISTYRIINGVQAETDDFAGMLADNQEQFLKWIVDLLELLIIKPELTSEVITIGEETHELLIGETIEYTITEGTSITHYRIYEMDGKTVANEIQLDTGNHKQVTYYIYVSDEYVKGLVDKGDGSSYRELYYDLGSYQYLNYYLSIDETPQSSILVYDQLLQARYNINYSPDKEFYVLHKYKNNRLMYGEAYLRGEYDFFFNLEGFEGWTDYTAFTSDLLLTNGETVNYPITPIPQNYLSPNYMIENRSSLLSEGEHNNPFDGLTFKAFTYEDIITERISIIDKYKEMFQVTDTSIFYDGVEYSFDEDFNFIRERYITTEIQNIIDELLN